MLLAGDAAHVHSPAGGQGMNCGLVDAVVLGQLLGDVLRGRRPPSDLDLYRTQGRPEDWRLIERFPLASEAMPISATR